MQTKMGAYEINIYTEINTVCDIVRRGKRLKINPYFGKTRRFILIITE